MFVVSIRSGGFALALLLGVSLFFVCPQAGLADYEGNAVEDCYRLAADPFDPQRVVPDRINFYFDEGGLEACQAALEEAPEDPRVNYHLGRFFAMYGGRERGRQEATYGYLKIAVEANYSAAKYWISYMSSSLREVDFPGVSAREFVEQASEEGYSYATYSLFLGSEDAEEKTAWLEKAVEQGNPYAKFHMAEQYRNGIGIKQDKEEAWRLYHEAAEGEDARAALVLFEGYSGELGWKFVDQNKKAARKWLLTSAVLWNRDALVRLGKMYFEGNGFEKSYVTALAYFLEAEKRGSESGAAAANWLRARMTPLDRSKAQLEAGNIFRNLRQQLDRL